MTDRPWITAVAIGVIIASLIWIVTQRKPTTPKVDLTPYTDAGQIVGEEVATSLGSGATVVILSGELAAGSPLQAQLDAFLKAIQQHGLTMIDRVQTAELVDTPTVFGYFDQYRQASALISFFGFPDTILEALAERASLPAKLIVVGCTRDQAKALCRHPQVPMVFALPDAPPAGSVDSQNPRSHFDQLYEIITPEQSGSES